MSPPESGGLAFDPDTRPAFPAGALAGTATTFHNANSDAIIWKKVLDRIVTTSTPAAAFDAEYDLVVLGSGASGLTAALVAAVEGAKVLVLESTPYVGGTSARSSGTVWIPQRDDATVSTYLDALVGDREDRALREAFLAAGPEMLACLEKHAGMKFRPYPAHPDYRQDLPGAAGGMRPLEPPEFDGRELGRQFERVGWPLPELMLFGGMMITRGEAGRLLRAGRSVDGTLLGARLVLRFLADRMRYSRGTRLVLGNAIVAALYKALLDRKVAVWYEAQTERLVANGEVRGAVVRHCGNIYRVRARRGVVLAGGGFPASAEWREKHLPHPLATHTPAYEGCVGSTIRLGQQAGGALGPSGIDNALWFPSSVARRADGSTAVYPHIVLDRGKPGLVAVGNSGERFTDEAVSYHEFTRAMYRTSNVPAWLVCDRRFVWKYGLGMIRPMTPRLAPYIESGYLHVSDSIEGLARAIGVDAAGLSATVGRNNEFARTGIDADFGKGGNAYDRGNGDAAHKPNPCVGTIAKAPFCAVRVEPTPLGTSLGLRTDVNAQVCNAGGIAIPGLYAVGNDMHSVMGGEYPGAGAQLGPGMTFGYLAARHAVRPAM
ncbi:MAG: FAD-dependent oxidoreductase [Proteobacteria bacterium]|nr:FAD-dependent oxidoreductase [Pseudomonadota bacterium]